MITQNRAGTVLRVHEDSDSPEDESSFLLTLAPLQNDDNLSLSPFIHLLPSNLRGGGLVVSHVQLLAIPWTVALQAPLYMGFPKQEYGSG